MTPLDFASERDEASTSWERANPTAALIEQIAWDRWLVTLRSGSTHEVRLERDHGAFIGECDCGDFRYRNGGSSSSPCAHLCTLRKADFGSVADTRGRPVRILDENDVDNARADYAVEKIAADGGGEWL